jgi:hypothetical protein
MALESASRNHFCRALIEPALGDDNDQIEFECQLCGGDNFTLDAVDEHCSLQTHIDGIQQIRKTQENPIVFAYSVLKDRIEDLGLQRWRNEIEAKFFKELVQTTIILPSTSIGNNKPLKEAIALLLKYETMEEISLLELAVWKAMCLATITSKPNASLGYYEWLEWTRHGWKCAKNDTRRSNAIGIVISSVLPFMK